MSYINQIVTSEDPFVLGGVEFPPGTRFSCDQSKRVKITDIDGRDGGVIESSGFGSWKVKIDVVLSSSLYDFGFASVGQPIANAVGVKSILQELREFRDLWKSEGSLRVVNRKLQVLGIRYLELESFSVPDDESYGEQPLSISAISDDGWDLDDPSSHGGES